MASSASPAADARGALTPGHRHVAQGAQEKDVCDVVWGGCVDGYSVLKQSICLKEAQKKTDCTHALRREHRRDMGGKRVGAASILLCKQEN